MANKKKIKAERDRLRSQEKSWETAYEVVCDQRDELIERNVELEDLLEKQREIVEASKEAVKAADDVVNAAVDRVRELEGQVEHLTKENKTLTGRAETAEAIVEFNNSRPPSRKRWRPGGPS